MSLPPHGDDPNHDQDLDKVIAESLASLDYHEQDKQQHDERLQNPYHEPLKSPTPIDQNQEELDLENAIGDVFNQLEFHQKEQNQIDHSQNNQNENIPHSAHDPEHKNDDFDLEAAIGNAFNSAFNQEQPQAEKEDEPNEALDLDAAIGDAFKSISHHVDQKKPEDLEKDKDLDKDLDDSLEDDDLEAAIGEAFSSIANSKTELVYDSNHVAYITKRPAPTEALAKAIGKAFGDEETIVFKSDKPAQPDMKDTITNAFNSVLQKDNSATAQAVAQLRKKSTAEPAELANLVQNIVNQISHNDDDKNSENLSVPEDVLQELALEITSHLQLSDELVSKRSKPASNVPQIDENIVEQFQIEANKDQPFKSALATAVRQAIESSEDKEADLENLQINDILQNAFTMAMENPQDLLNNLEMDEEKKKEAVLEKAPEKPAEKKPLSIAETLAFHRSSMSTLSRDYSSVSDLSKLQISSNPQLSQVLSSLSSHIQSSGSDNILQVIRQMTNALSLSKSQTKSVPSLYDVVSRYIGSADQSLMVKSLDIAKKFLTDKKDQDLSGALALVNKVIQLFPANTYDTETKYREIKFENLDSLNESVISAIKSSSASSRHKTPFIHDRPTVDSPEYKERVRMENRERKKKWREGNAERNKDNDLRSRVIKRANLTFGDKDSLEKRAWIEDEFTKRREKRIAKQKKDDGSLARDLLNSPDDTKSEQNSKIVGSIGDIFDMFLASNKDDTKAMLGASSAVSCAMLVIHPTTSEDLAEVDGSIGSIILAVFDGAASSGNNDKLRALSRAVLTVKSQSNSEAAANIGIKNINLKRPSVETSPSKRSKPSPENYDKMSISKIASEINDMRNSISSSWGLSISLKMPSYKRPEGATKTPEVEEEVKKEGPTLSLASTSPFISNKNLGSKSPNLGLRRPGSFQRPAPKNKSLGFPPLYSTPVKDS